ncbi:MAG: GTPase HflX, partial [Bacteroidetes bacterium]|nr:GTPase HflX [Bacteroidota bacterium]
MLDFKETVYEKAVLIGVINREQPLEKVEEYLDELAFLTYTAGGEVIKRFIQKVDIPNPKTLIGSGKMEEVEAFVE